MTFARGVSDFLALNRRFYRNSAEEIRSYQWEEISKLLSIARRDSPFYRNFYRDIEIGSLDDFPNLPAIGKTVMMENFDTLNTAGLRKDDLLDYALEKERNKDYLGYFQDKFVVGLSSGTSGNKGVYVTPRTLTERLPAVFLARGGIPLRYLPFRILFLLRVFSQGFQDIRSPIVSLTYRSTMTEPGRIVECINRDRINVLMAPPSLLRIIAPLAGRIRRKLRLIVSYAEVLESEEKERLESAFGCGAVQIYQASEGQIGSACRRGNLHINEDLVYVELYDENGESIVRPNVPARKMVVTNLVNTVQPLIRYEMNDLIELGPSCPCGSRFRTIAKVIGRNDDVCFFKTLSGEIRPVFPDLISRWIITAGDAVREFRVRQDDDHSLDITVEIPDDTDPETVRSALLKRFTAELDAWNVRADIRIRFDRIPLPPDNSKFKRFISVRNDAARSS